MQTEKTHAAARGRGDSFRHDIQGLRAVAVGLVLLAHAGVPFAEGGYLGVDVFFVISGFLITGLLVSEVERTGTVSLSVFYARRIKRLLPLAVTVLAVTVIGAVVLFPPVRGAEVSADVIAAALYVANWKFATDAVDYFAQDAAESPLQHFWSLAVEEQFYLVWPLLLLGVTLWWRRRSLPVRPAVWAVLAAATAASFAYAVHLSAVAEQQAYFSTFARVWELSAGGLLALALSGRRLGPRAAGAAAWAGAGALLSGTIAFDGGSGFPGVAALVPVLGAAALIAAGTAVRPSAPIRVLLTAPMRRVGALSYAWYLWHWPALVFATAAFGRPLTVAEGLSVVVLTYVPTLLSHRHIEEPLRRSPIHVRAPRAAIAAAPAAGAVAVALGIGLSLALPSTPTLAARDADGATALDRERTVQTRAAALRPNPRDAEADRGRVYEDGCLVPVTGSRSGACVYGRRKSDTTVVLLGDSHAMHHFPALQRVSLRRGWRLVVLTKAGCSPARMGIYNHRLGRRYTECDTWRERALRRIEAERPRMVVASSSTHYAAASGTRKLGRSTSRSAFVSGYAETLRRLRRASPRVVALRDTPRPPDDRVPDCVAEHTRHLQRCAFTKREAFVRPSLEERAVKRAGRVRLLSATGRFCIGRICPAVIGDVLVYRNTGHLTATYSRTMAGWFARRLPKRL